MRVVAQQYRVSRAGVDRLKRRRETGEIERAGATLRFLPPYSPDLNPIALVFAKLTALARGAAQRAREDLWTSLGSRVSRFSPGECRHSFRQCGSTAT